MSLKRLPVISFGLLAIATVGAFFLTQHLKTANPLVWGQPTPVPTAFDPVHGRTSSCVSRSKQLLNYRQTSIPISLWHGDTVGVYVVNADNAAGPPVATISTGTPMTGGPLGKAEVKTFTWNGRLSNGQVAPDGTYFFRIVLERRGDSINLSDSPVRIVTKPPQARVLGIKRFGQKGKQHGPVVFTPPHGSLKISYTPGKYRRLWIDIYRTDVTGTPEKVAEFPADPKGRFARWNGMIDGQPAPAGTYLVGLTAQNAACDQAQWPVVVPPTAGTTPGAGITIRYLTVTPPLTPTVSGSRASVAVSSPSSAYRWNLRATGSAKVLAHGSGAAGDGRIEVPMPRHKAGLYTLVVRAGKESSAVPLVASRAGLPATRAPVLVVLPMLTWVGNSPVDDTGDGVPATLKAGDPASLSRPIVDGLPASLTDDADLLDYLDSMHRDYQLTTDVALAEGRGPSLVDRWGVVFPDGEEFLPAQLVSQTGPAGLGGFVKGGGHVLAVGTGTFQGTSELSGFPSHPQAAAPVKSSSDPFGATRGPVTPTGGELITELADDLNLFGGTVAFAGFSHYQPIEPPAGVHVSAAGIANQSPAIVAFPDGSGTVVEVGLPNFGVSLTHNIDSQDLTNNVWRLLARPR